MSRYYHGGAPGLRPGDYIEPPTVTNARRLIDSLTYVPPEEITRPDVVYVTTVREVAKAYAAFYPDGACYRVEPVGDVEPDPDCNVPGLSWRAVRARVVAVVDPVVLLRERPHHWLRVVARGGRP